MAKPDPNRVLRLMPIAVGTIAGILLLTNRILTPMLTDSQARADALGVILSAILILTGLLWQQIQPRTPDSVELVGQEGFEFAPDLPESVKAELAWASHILLTNTVTRSLIVWYRDRVILPKSNLAQFCSVF
jgi:nitrate reductase gamma subunit